MSESALTAEQAVLGAVMLAEDAYWSCADLIRSHDFHRPDHRRIWEAVERLAAEGSPRDAVTVAEALGRAGGRDLPYIIELANNAPGAANIRAYAEIVQRHSEQRRIAEAGRKIAALPPGSADEACRLLNSAIRPDLKQDRPMRQVLGDWYTQLEGRMSAGEIVGVRTGIEDLDAALCGLQAGDLVIVAGRPSMGKSAFAAAIMHGVASGGVPTGVFSLEMTDVAFANRMVAARSGVPLEQLKAPSTISEQGWVHVTAAVSAMQSLPLHFDPSTRVTGPALCARIRQMATRLGVRVVIIDYLQLLEIDRSVKADRRDIAIGDITRSLKLIAKELGITVILLSQLNRSLESRADRRPILSDLRESGAIEQDADVVLFIYRDEVYNKDTPDRGITEVIIGKQREGALATVYLQSDLRIGRYSKACPREQRVESEPVRRFADRRFKK